MDDIGVVIIGRNEGARLRSALESVVPSTVPVVYVDSGSIDGSVQLARATGAEVVELDSSLPFTAARARNTGFARMKELKPDVGFVQFLDGDCALEHGWLDAARQVFRENTSVGLVAGRLREVNREGSRYNRLCDLEWERSPGLTEAIGGVFMVRVVAFDATGGFNELLIAGEEPELCVRSRELGWQIRQIEHEMGRHDAAMTRFGQWWKRAVRTGHAYAEGAALHGHGPFRHNVRRVWSSLIWGAGVPLILLSFLVVGFLKPSLWLVCGVAMAMLILQWARIALHRRRLGNLHSDSLLYATFCLIGKPAAVIGIVAYWINRFRGHQINLIEYKNPSVEKQSA